MTCPKCQGLLYRDTYKAWTGWTCVNCGLRLDRVILLNKHTQAAPKNPARDQAESLFKK